MFEIKDINEAAPTPQTVVVNTTLCLDILSILQRFCSNLREYFILSETSINHLLCMIKNSPPLARLSALRVASDILPYVIPDVVDLQARNIGLFPVQITFVEHLFASSGKVFNFWSKYSNAKIIASNSSEFEYAFAVECIKLLRVLCLSELWQNQITSVLFKISQVAPKVVGLATSQAHTDCESDHPSTSIAPMLINDLDTIFGMIALLGGQYKGFYIGCTAYYHTGEQYGAGVLEECTIISPTWPPSSPPSSPPSVADDKERESFRLKWKGLEEFGDAVCVVFILLYLFDF